MQKNVVEISIPGRHHETKSIPRCLSHMQVYKKTGDTGISFFEIGRDFIILQFRAGEQYLYNYSKPGKKHVESMKKLAPTGEGLTTYVNKYVRENYAKKLR